MRIILSRKGFDTEYGQMPSPIMPDGTLLSLPIPAKNEKINYTELQFNGKTYYEIIKDLSSKTKIKETYTCHLDPDLRKEAIKRKNDWKPLFGQAKAACSHLFKQGVSNGDIFLFFGSFRQTHYINGHLSFIKTAPVIHIIFGYFQIGKLHLNQKSFPSYLMHHPHTNERFTKLKYNCIFEASNELSLNNSLNGASTLNFHDNLVLTKPGYPKSRWKLPNFFKELAISYHSENSFQKEYFQSASKGQEFVIESNPQLTKWALKIIQSGIKK
jgi:hypothetical protein